jgi:hypothetical protein
MVKGTNYKAPDDALLSLPSSAASCYYTQSYPFVVSGDKNPQNAFLGRGREAVDPMW